MVSNLRLCVRLKCNSFVGHIPVLDYFCSLLHIQFRIWYVVTLFRCQISNTDVEEGLYYSFPSITLQYVVESIEKLHC